MILIVLLLCSSPCFGQTQSDPDLNETIANPLTEKIGNFSIELVYHTSAQLASAQNMMISPITVWTALAVISEGATSNTKLQIRNAIRIPRNKTAVRMHFAEVARWLRFSKTDTIELVKFNGVFIDKEMLPLVEFQEDAKTYYETDIVSLHFNDPELAASLLNQVISNFTHGRIPPLVQRRDFEDTPMVLSSAMFFKGKWSIPFNTTLTRRKPFYDIDRNQIGEVNMMFNRASYPFAEIKVLGGRVVEVPIGKENRLSMVIMLPNYGVSLENMFLNFQRLSLDAFFKEFKPLINDFSHTEVELYLPRFKIKSDLDLTEVLKQRFGVTDMFDARKAILPYMARMLIHASKLIHKAEIEVTEEGTAQEEDAEGEFSNRVSVIWFEVNRPFIYMIVDKIANTIILEGIYRQPSLY